MKKPSKVAKALTPAKKTNKPVRQAKPAAPASVAAAVVAAVSPPKEATVINAHIDVGFGNRVYIRGEGAGLSWDRGLQMECVSADRWTVVLEPSKGPIAFKFLINDEVWCASENYTASPGTTVGIAPTF